MGDGWAARAARTPPGKQPALGCVQPSVCLSGWVATQPTPRLPYPPPRLAPNTSERLLASVLQLNLTHDADFGVFACWVSNATATFTLRRVGRDMPGRGQKGHLPGGPACTGQEWQPRGILAPLPAPPIGVQTHTKPRNPGLGAAGHAHPTLPCPGRGGRPRARGAGSPPGPGAPGAPGRALRPMPPERAPLVPEPLRRPGGEW